MRAAIARAVAPARRLVAGTGRVVGLVVVPESSEEAVVEVGLVMVAVGCLVAGYAPLALLIPGGLLVAIGLGFNLRRRA